ncbi:MAG: polysaccharide deacetylase family protein [Rhizobiaceae bacterium]|nr:polysaccharide deacetylase family protein [Rhizobiaceae bacterium]
MTTITLTFDNGPDPDVTPMVLRTLRRHGTQATFFVIGEKLRDRRRLSEHARGEGHWIGNHTYTHLVPLGQSREGGVALREIEQTDTLLGDLAHPRQFFRPFGNGGNLGSGLLNREALRYLQASGHTCILWNAVPEDWVYPESWVERALDLCFANEHSLLVLHDLPTGAMTHLDTFLHRAKDRGATFVQEFPGDCIILESGRIVRDIQPYLSD